MEYFSASLPYIAVFRVHFLISELHSIYFVLLFRFYFLYLNYKEINNMSRVSLKKYGFVPSPDHNFSDDGNYFFASQASINGCEV